MRRRSFLLFLVLLFLPVTLHANTALTVPDPFFENKYAYDYRYPDNRQEYIALCRGYLYKSPLDATPVGIFHKGQALHIEYRYRDLYLWGLVTDANGKGIGWVPMDAMQRAYGAKDYLDDHWASLKAYVGELDPFLPTQAEREAIDAYRIQNTGSDSPSERMAFDYPVCTKWAYPNAPVNYGSIWLPDIYPVHTLIDENGVVWVYAHNRHLIDLGNTEQPFWVCVSDLSAKPDPRAPALLPEPREAPTHLPVPGQLALQKVSFAGYIAPVLPVLLAVAFTMLLSAVLVVLLKRKTAA